MASRAFEQAHAAIIAAHRQFMRSGLKALWPQASGLEIGRAMLREQRYGATYEQRARRRLRLGIGRVETAPGLTDAERAQKIGQVLAAERRYLEARIAKVGHRLSDEADRARLRAAGEPGGVWVLDPSKRTHTADCLAMESRFWPWSVLDVTNPGNRHAGCGCRIVSMAEARNMGIQPRRGVMTSRRAQLLQESAPAGTELVDLALADRVREGVPLAEAAAPFGEDLRARFALAIALEAIRVPIRQGVRWDEHLHPRGPGGRFTSVNRALSREHHGHLNAYLKAVKAEDQDAADRSFAELHKRVRKVRTAAASARKRAKEGTKAYDRAQRELKVAERDLRTIHAVRHAAVNPSGARAPVGSHVRVGDRRVPVPLTTREPGDALGGPWAPGNTYRWQVKPDDLGSGGQQLLDNLARSKYLEVKPQRDGTAIIQTRRGKGIKPADRHQAAMALETVVSQLHRQRVTKPGQLFDDDRPLDPLDLPSDANDLSPVYRNISKGQIGDAGESAIMDVRDALLELGVIDKSDSDFHWPTAGRLDLPIDWVINSRAIEVKAHGWRGLTPGGETPRPKIDRKGEGGGAIGRKKRWVSAANRERKAEGKGALKHSLVQMFVDLDDDTVHVFMYDYPRGSDPGAVRVPADMFQELVDGTLKPGESRRPRGAKAPTRYVGSFRLRVNPKRHREEREGDEYRRDLHRRATDPERKTAANRPGEYEATEPPPKADHKARNPRTPAKASAELRADLRAYAKGTLTDRSGRAIGQRALAAKHGITQPRVTQLLGELGLRKPGRGRSPASKAKPRTKPRARR